MRKRAFALLLSAGIACVLTPVPAAGQNPPAERPTYSVGERWILNDGVYDLIKIEKDFYIFAAGAGRQIHLSKNLGVTTVLRGGAVEWEVYPPPEPSWPLEVGKWGVTDSILRNRDHPSGVRVQVTWEIKRLETVQVVAGTFKVFRIAYTIDPEELFRSLPTILLQSWRIVTWYAPEARMIVKSESFGLESLNFQVVALDRPQPAPLKVIVDEPRDKARLTTDRIGVDGKVTSGAGVARVTATLNGAEVFGRDEQGASDVKLRFPITLREGKNVLLITATDVNGNRQQQARALFYDRPPSASVGAPSLGPPVVSARPPKKPLPPLQLVISSPLDQARVNDESIALAGFVSGGAGTRQVQVTLNAVEVSRLEEPWTQRSVAVNLPLKLREGPNTLVVTATDAHGAATQDVRTIYYERVVPLTVQIRYPARARVTEQETTVAALVTSSKGVAEVSVMLNGTKVFDRRERVPQKSVTVVAPVKLREGTNVIMVSATDPDGTGRQDIRTVVYERGPAGSTPPGPRPRATRKRWAVVIGVGGYESTEIPTLAYSVPDAEAFYDVLIRRAGFKKENVLLLTDKTERKPTLRNVKWALGTFLARSANKEDLVVIFFAGHGAPEVDPRGVESDGLSKYLVPSDADPNDLYSTGLPMDEFQIIFHRIEAERVVVFLDSCYSGAAGGRTFASRRTRASRVDDVFLERLTRSKGRAIIAASRPAEVSLELRELGHGIFTYYLLQGLKGTADLDRDGIVSLQELYQYVGQKVTQKSRAEGGNQHPIMKGELEGNLPLVKVSRR
ncbi:MAG: caspase domain-containing protein [Anaerolineae bacterium]